MTGSMIDITDQTFGRLTAKYSFKNEAGRTLWHCECSCSGTVDVRAGTLRAGDKQSCGCLYADVRHGYAKRGERVAEYTAWLNMRARCYDPKRRDFKFWGGKGITVCDRWLYGEADRLAFECFLDDVGPKPSPKHSLERRRGDEPYSPDNCVWETVDAQSRNRRSNVIIQFQGRAMHLYDALALSGNGDWRYYDIKKARNLSPQEAFDLMIATPIQTQKRRGNYKGDGMVRYAASEAYVRKHYDV